MCPRQGYQIQILKNTEVDQEIFDTKSGEKLGDIFIEIMKQFRGCVSKKTAIFVNMSVCYYLLPG